MGRRELLLGRSLQEPLVSYAAELFLRHRIPLGETDAVTPLPPLGKHFTVRCDECRKTYIYKPKDVMRVEMELPETFRPHPLFREELAFDDANPSTGQQPRQQEPPQEGSPQKEPTQDGQTKAKGA